MSTEKKIRIAFIGGWHVHYLDFSSMILKTSPNCIAGGVWDNDPVRGKAWGEALGCPFEPDIDKLLADPAIDAVMITCETSLHGQMAVKAARAGKHIFLEKAPTTSLQEMYELRDAVKESGVHFTQSLHLEKPAVYKAKELADVGLFGTLTGVRMRTVNHFAFPGGPYDSFKVKFYDKSVSGGGVAIDIGFPSLNTLCLFLGKPVSVSAMAAQFTENAKAGGVEDASVQTFLFESGAVGTLETSWYANDAENACDIYGTEGCARVTGNHLSYCTYSDMAWHDFPDEDLPPVPQKCMFYWLDSILNDTPNELYNVDMAVQCMEMLDGVYRAQEQVTRL